MTLKKAKVHLIPTKKESSILIKGDIYITSDDKIRKNDWYLFYCCGNNELPELMQCKNNDEADRCNTSNLIAPYCHKIIATTCNIVNDKCFTCRTKEVYDITTDCTCHSLPQPSNDFINKYIKKYNENEQIFDILVEYNDYETCFNYNDHINKDCSCKSGDFRTSPKIDKNNCITIKHIRKTLKDLCLEDKELKEEVEELLYKATLNANDESFDFYKWLKDNWLESK